MSSNDYDIELIFDCEENVFIWQTKQKSIAKINHQKIKKK